MKRDLLLRQQTLECEIRRVTSPGRADIAGAAAAARSAAIVCNRILRLRSGLERDAAPVAPLFQPFQAPGERNRRHRVRFGALVSWKRTRFTRYTQPALRFAIELFQLRP